MLIVSNLTKTYDNGVKALKGIDLPIEKGMYGLLGPNGAGKSSLMRTIATLQAADSGKIIFNKEDAVSNPQAIRRHLGYLPQSFGVYPNISAINLLNHLAILKGVTNKADREKQVIYLLHQTNLFQHRKKAVSSFSGGMKQRFGIAQALLADPKLIIVDEPTTGLDPEERNRFHNLLSEISEETIVILSTHIVEDIQNLCPNLAILISGQIKKRGSPYSLLRLLEGKVWRALVNKNDMAFCYENLNVISHRLVSGKIELRVMSDNFPALNLPEVVFQPVAADLEDLYFSTIQQSQES